MESLAGPGGLSESRRKDPFFIQVKTVPGVLENGSRRCPADRP